MPSWKRRTVEMQEKGLIARENGKRNADSDKTYMITMRCDRTFNMLR